MKCTTAMDNFNANEIYLFLNCNYDRMVPKNDLQLRQVSQALVHEGVCIESCVGGKKERRDIPNRDDG